MISITQSIFTLCIFVCLNHFGFGTPRYTLVTDLYSNHSKNEKNIMTKFAPPRSGEFSGMFVRPADCEELLQLGNNRSGVYSIWPRTRLFDRKRLQVFCDMETDDGGWTVIQRRGDFLRPKDYFYRDWTDYKIGFGDIERDFWLGNDNIFALTNQRLYSVRFDLTDVEGEQRYALYDIFFIDSEENKYKLTIKDYSGTANDSMTVMHNGRRFSTKDQDNDNYKDNCATMHKGGWWYKACLSANLNCLYDRGKHDTYIDGINWSEWKGFHESLVNTEIKIRPKNFHKTLI